MPRSIAAVTSESRTPAPSWPRGTKTFTFVNPGLFAIPLPTGASPDDLDVDGAHVVVASAGCEPPGRDFLDTSEVALREPNFGRGYILFEISTALGAGYRDHVVALRQHPCER